MHNVRMATLKRHNPQKPYKESGQFTFMLQFTITYKSVDNTSFE